MAVQLAVKPTIKAKLSAPASTVITVAAGVKVDEEVVSDLVKNYDNKKAIAEELKAATKLYDTAEEKFLAEVVAVPAEDKIEFVYDNRTVSVTKQTAKTEITADMMEIADALNKVEVGLFLKLCKISLTDLRAYLTPKQLEAMTKTEDSGSRRVSIK